MYSHNTLPQITLPTPGYGAHSLHCQKSPSCYPHHMVINDIKASLDSAKILETLEPQLGYADQMVRDQTGQL